jgi:hypothetical protein
VSGVIAAAVAAAAPRDACRDGTGSGAAGRRQNRIGRKTLRGGPADAAAHDSVRIG